MSATWIYLTQLNRSSYLSMFVPATCVCICRDFQAGRSETCYDTYRVFSAEIAFQPKYAYIKKRTKSHYISFCEEKTDSQQPPPPPHPPLTHMLIFFLALFDTLIFKNGVICTRRTQGSARKPIAWQNTHHRKS